MSDLKSRLIRSTAVCVFACVSLPAHAGPSSETAPVAEASGAETSASIDVLSAQPLVGDDPVAVRDALAKESRKANSPSLSDRVEKLFNVPTHRKPRDPDLAKAGLDRDLAFVVPAPYGILYRSTTHLLTVNVDLSGDETPGVILLRKTITGPRGRGLVVAAEAKAKGYIQNIDLIGLDSREGRKTTVRGRATLPPSAFSKANGAFAVVLICSLVPPYLNDRSEHSDPTNEEPTDITTRTSTLHANIHAIWLVSPQKGTVLSKNLHLSK
ncbi:hypothetical protein [Paraburkholderia sp. BL10I2N1]|uniref:hypothetical protein n=1 Tax=Paraburkholderia sp. BL10I2N1 TaxID=1938796 RepID=UPI00105CC9D2|nr:hypothetical protein [Paraburkholderia sp. BL10I2N1]TDN62752.1 hypothetical protein B0G77_6341 [Paraburkholderia sp. BL10I2N1]